MKISPTKIHNPQSKIWSKISFKIFQLGGLNYKASNTTYTPCLLIYQKIIEKNENKEIKNSKSWTWGCVVCISLSLCIMHMHWTDSFGLFMYQREDFIFLNDKKKNGSWDSKLKGILWWGGGPHKNPPRRYRWCQHCCPFSGVKSCVRKFRNHSKCTE